MSTVKGWHTQRVTYHSGTSPMHNLLIKIVDMLKFPSFFTLNIIIHMSWTPRLPSSKDFFTYIRKKLFPKRSTYRRYPKHARSGPGRPTQPCLHLGGTGHTWHNDCGPSGHWNINLHSSCVSRQGVTSTDSSDVTGVRAGSLTDSGIKATLIFVVC